MLSVITLLPLEAGHDCELARTRLKVLVGAIQGEGGPIYWLSMWLTNAIVGSSKADIKFDSPTKATEGLE